VNHRCADCLREAEVIQFSPYVGETVLCQECVQKRGGTNPMLGIKVYPIRELKVKL
jgi:recombinational DNA repair protein (RecF pathway)